MKNKSERPRCLNCGTFLYNDISKVLGYCGEHRPALTKEYEAKFRQFMKEYPLQAQADIKSLREAHTCGHEHET